MTYFPSDVWKNILDMVPSVANHTAAHRRKVSEYESRNPAVAAFHTEWEEFLAATRSAGYVWECQVPICYAWRCLDPDGSEHYQVSGGPDWFLCGDKIWGLLACMPEDSLTHRRILTRHGFDMEDVDDGVTPWPHLWLPGIDPMTGALTGWEY